MLTEKQVTEVKEHLETAQNPLFLFDNDQDGLCSFLLLQRYIERGRGFPVKSAPLTSEYFRRVQELDADYLFILDVPTVENSFWEELEKINLPVVWIDHHDTDPKDVPEFVNYYNPFFNEGKTNEPTTALCHQVANRKDDAWLAVVGCISDKYFPPFYSDVQKKYPDLTIDSDDPFHIYYNSEIGKVARMFEAGLKDRTTHVIKMMKFLTKVKTPQDVLTESSQNNEMHEKFNIIQKKYEKFYNKAISEIGDGKLIFFEYGGETSMSAQLANGLSYEYPDKILFVAYLTDGAVNISGRGVDVKPILEKAFEGIDNARGGGHQNAVGGRILRENLEQFKENLFKIVK